MRIMVDGKPAVMKKDFVIEYNEENPLFVESEGYSLSIEFPLSNCVENTRIFGHITRMDIDTPTGVFHCSIETSAFTKEGILTIIEVSEKEVKGQFLEGLSSNNYLSSIKSLNNIYVDELDIGPFSLITKWSPGEFFTYYNDKAKWFFFPWEDTESNIIYNYWWQNLANEEIINEWANPSEPLTAFPFLLPLTEDILSSLGYSVDFAEWAENEDFANLVVCNAFVGQNFLSESLPHWNVKDFLYKVGLFIGGFFCIDEIRKTIKFKSYTSVSKNEYLDKVLFNHKIESIDDCKYLLNSNIRYKDREDESWKYECCSELLSNFKIVCENSVKEFDTFVDLMSYFGDKLYIQISDLTLLEGENSKLFYVKDCDTYFAFRNKENDPSVSGNYFYLYPVNRFGNYIVSDESPEIEIEIVPAPIEHMGYAFNFSYSSWLSKVLVYPRSKKNGITLDPFSYIDSIPQPCFMANLLNDKKEIEKSSFELLPVAFLRKDIYSEFPTLVVDKVVNWGLSESSFNYFGIDFTNLRCNRFNSILPRIDASNKFNIEFISEKFPDVKSVFYIQGKKYLCEKITVDITSNGVSQLKKGIFYKIID